MRALLVVLALLLAGCGGSSGPEPREVVAHPVAMKAGGEVAPPPWASDIRLGNVDTGFDGAEPNVGVTSSGAVFVTAFETIIRSTDVGRSWEAVHELGIGTTRDPMLFVDTATDRIFSLHLFPDQVCTTELWSDDEGETWFEKPVTCNTPLMDHQKHAAGPGGGPLYPSLVSLCYNKPNAGTVCAISRDGGLTYVQEVLVDGPGLTPLQLTGPPACGGLNGHQHHGAGAIFVPYGYQCKEARIAVSGDDGLTWERRDLGKSGLALDPEVTTTVDGTAYYMSRGDDHLPYLLRSSDRFATTEGPWDLAPPGVGATVFTAMAGGADGRIAFAFLGSSDFVGIPDDAPDDARWYLYIGMSHDADAPEPTFVTWKLPGVVQRGSICMDKECTTDRGGINRNLLDFIDLTAGPDGRFYVAYTDGCTRPSCVDGGPPSTSRSERTTVAYLLEGEGLAGHPVAAPPGG